MLRAIDENTITDAAIEQMAATPNPRLKQIMEPLVRHLHAWAREADLTPEEWLQGISSLHDKRAAEAGTKSSLVGPFYRQDSPAMKLGDSIVTKPSKGLEVVLYGRVTDRSGKGIPNASVEVWQPDETGSYDLQKHDPSEM